MRPGQDKVDSDQAGGSAAVSWVVVSGDAGSGGDSRNDANARNSRSAGSNGDASEDDSSSPPHNTDTRDDQY